MKFFENLLHLFIHFMCSVYVCAYVRSIMSTMACVGAVEDNLQELGIELRSSFLVVNAFIFWVSLDAWMD